MPTRTEPTDCFRCRSGAQCHALNFSFGSDCDSPRFENMARKLPVKFRLLEAAGRHWILTTLKRPLSLGRSDGSLLSGADVHGAR